MIFSHHHAHAPARRDVDMPQGSITRHLIQFALPLLAGNVFQQLYNMVDTWVVGNFVSNEAFSAVGTVGPIINMLIGFFMGLSGGAGVVISQYYGAHRPEKVRDTVHTAMVLTLVLCAAFTALGLALIPAMLALMNTPAEVLPESTAYLSIYFSGITGLLIYNMGSGILRAVGDSRRPFYFLVVSAVLNTGLDLVFVIRFRMGVAGVAWATIIAQAASAVLVLAVLGAAWLAAPHVLDWATHTWYTVVKNRDLEAESASRAAASSEAAASSAVQEAASSQPEPEQPKELDGKAITGGSWAAVDVSTLADDAAIRAAAQQLKAQGADYGLVTLKTPDGSICYASQVPAAAQSIAGTTVDPARIAAIFREEGVIPVAQLAAFKDPISSRTDRSMAIHYGDGLWLDAQKDGNAWLNPYSAAAVEYVGDLVAEVQGMGFEQVVLTNVQFPKLSRKQDYGETSGVSRADQLKADIAALQSRFAGSMTLWFSYTLDQCNTNSVSLDVPAVTLGMDNLLVTADKAMDADSRTALEQSAAGQGVQHLVLHSADIFQ